MNGCNEGVTTISTNINAAVKGREMPRMAGLRALHSTNFWVAKKCCFWMPAGYHAQQAAMHTARRCKRLRITWSVLLCMMRDMISWKMRPGISNRGQETVTMTKWLPISPLHTMHWIGSGAVLQRCSLRCVHTYLPDR